MTDDDEMTTIILGQKDYEFLMRTLEAPPKPAQALIDLMRRKSVWNKVNKESE